MEIADKSVMSSRDIGRTREIDSLKDRDAQILELPNVSWNVPSSLQ